MKMEMDIKFKCGNVAKVHFLTIKNKTLETSDIYLRASFEDHSFLGTNEPIEHHELKELSDLVRAIHESLSKITSVELENNVMQLGVRIPVKLK